MTEVYILSEGTVPWIGDLDELVQANQDLPEWQLVMLETLRHCTPGSYALVGEEASLFRVQVV